VTAGAGVATLFGLHPFLLKLYADGGYQGPIFQSAVANFSANRRGDRQRSDSQRALAVLPKRWIVERPLPAKPLRAWPRIGSASTERPCGFAPRLNPPHAEKALSKQIMIPDKTLRYDLGRNVGTKFGAAAAVGFELRPPIAES